MLKTKFYRPQAMRLTYGSIFDSNGLLVDMQERGLDDFCEDGKAQKHQWLLLPKEEGQKQYLYCLKCGTPSHF